MTRRNKTKVEKTAPAPTLVELRINSIDYEFTKGSLDPIVNQVEEILVNDMGPLMLHSGDQYGIWSRNDYDDAHILVLVRKWLSKNL